MDKHWTNVGHGQILDMDKNYTIYIFDRNINLVPNLSKRHATPKEYKIEHQSKGPAVKL